MCVGTIVPIKGDYEKTISTSLSCGLVVTKDSNPLDPKPSTLNPIYKPPKTLNPLNQKP